MGGLWRPWAAWLLGSRRGQRRRARTARRRERPFRRLTVERLEDRSLLAATLLGTVWQDLNSDGQQTGGEPAIQYAVAELFSSTNGTVGDADDVSLGTRITDAAGNYQFTGLAAGVNHFVVVRPPVGFAFTVQDTGPDATDSDVGATGVSEMFAPADLSTVDLDAGLSGAAPAFGWAVHAGGASFDAVESIAVDAQGFVFVAGRFVTTADMDVGPGTSSVVSDGTQEMVVAKYSPAGALVWVRQTTGTGSHAGFHLVLDRVGNIVVVGQLGGSADFDPGPGTTILSSAGGVDAFVWKLTTNGELVWATKIGGSANDVSRSVAVDSQNHIVVAGSFIGTVDFDPGPGMHILTGLGSNDIFVWKLDASGNLVWARSSGSTGIDLAHDIAIDGADNILVGGYFSGSIDFDPGVGTAIVAPTGGEDAYVWKLDSAGNLVWVRTVGGAPDDWVEGVAIGPGDSVFAVGFFGGSADFDPGSGSTILTSAGSDDAFVWKLDSGGGLEWARRAGGFNNSDQADAVTVDSQGNVYVVGNFYDTVDFDPGLLAFNLTSVGVGDVFVWGLTASGEFRFAHRAGGSLFDTALDVQLDPDGAVVLAGIYRAVSDFDPTLGVWSLPFAGGDDLFLARWLPVTLYAAKVTGVFVRGTGDASGTGNDEWQAGYVAHLGAVGLGDAALGYRVSVGADQLDTLPWTNVDTVSIRFSEGVTVTSGHLQVIGAAEGPAVPSVASFSYNASTFTATWQFATPLPANKYLLHLATGVVVGLDSLALDGEWADGVSTSSGNAAAGGAFSFRMNVVPGDVNGDTVLTQSVTNADVLLTKQRFGTDTSDGASYAYRRDVNGSGFITNPDVLLIKQQQSLGTSIFDYSEPVPPPPGPDGESSEEESFAAARLTEPWHTAPSSTDSALAEPVAPEGTIDLEAWDAAILAMYGQTKK